MPFCKSCGRINDPNAKFCGVCGASLGGSEQPTQMPATTPTYPMPPPPPPPTYGQPAAYQPPRNYQQQPATYSPQPTYQSQPASQQPATSRAPMPTQGGAEKVMGVIPLRKPKSMGRCDSFTGVVTDSRMIFAQMTSQMINDAVTQARAQAKADGKGFWGQWSEQLRATFTYSRKYLSMEPNAILAETTGNCALDNRCISEVKVKLKNISRGEDVEVNEFELEVSSAQGKYEFRMEEQSEFVILLKQVYGDRVKMPFGYFSHNVNVKLF